MGYLTNFIVYTLAMVGIIIIAMIVFKSSSGMGIKHKSKFLKVIDTMSLGPRKTLYIVSAGKEKFLIAGDVDKTSLISKLSNEDVINLSDEVSSQKNSKDTEDYYTTSFKDTLLAQKQEQYQDISIKNMRTNIRNAMHSGKNAKTSVIKTLAEQLCKK